MSARPTVFRERVVTVEAMQWDGTAQGATPIIDWILAAAGVAHFRCSSQDTECSGTDVGHTFTIRTPADGSIDASPGDWIVRGLDGEFRPWSPGIFSATYQPVIGF